MIYGNHIREKTHTDGHMGDAPQSMEPVYAHGPENAGLEARSPLV